MKIELLKDKKTNRIPKVGEFWKHTNDNTIYLRIVDEIGEYYNHKNLYENRFYSIPISDKKIQVISSTHKSSKDFIILEQIGNLVLKEKDCENVEAP